MRAHGGYLDSRFPPKWQGASSHANMTFQQNGELTMTTGGLPWWQNWDKDGSREDTYMHSWAMVSTTEELHVVRMCFSSWFRDWLLSWWMPATNATLQSPHCMCRPERIRCGQDIVLYPQFALTSEGSALPQLLQRQKSRLNKVLGKEWPFFIHVLVQIHICHSR